MDSDLLKKCWFLAGPTAGGKTATSLCLASHLNAEIVSMDSMAIYRHMNIGTAKPGVSERSLVPHHMIDIIEPHQEYSVSDFVAAASVVCEEIHQRGAVPLFVGGTGLYLRSLLRGVFDGPDADWELRARRQAEVDRHGNQWLHDQLRLVDPETAARLHPNDVRRMIRALEVFEVTGIPLSLLHAQSIRALPDRPTNVFWLDPPRDWLHDRINRRVDLMMESGLLDEVRRLLEIRPHMSRTARQALGYRELIAHLEDGTVLEVAVEQIKTGTRQFAKRQHTWFRNMEECRAVAIDGDESESRLAELIQQNALMPGT